MSVETLVELLATTPDAFEPQKSVGWHPEAWLGRLEADGDRAEAIRRVSEASNVSNGWHQIDRAGVRRVAAMRDPLHTFIASQVWGYGPRGYGAYRVAKVLGLTKDSALGTGISFARERLAVAAQKCRDDGGVRAFEYLVNDEGRLPNLGAAFLTKYLYFVPDPAAPKPLILDDVVRRVIERHARERLRLSFGRTYYYADYLALVDELAARLAAEHGIERRSDDVEAALFAVGKK